MFGKPKTKRNMGKQTLGEKLYFKTWLWEKKTFANPQIMNLNLENVYGNYRRKKRLYNPPNHESLVLSHSAIHN